MRRFAGLAGKDKTGAAAQARLWSLAVGLLLVLPVGGAAQVAPDAAWRTFQTQHFSVTFPAGLDDVGRHAAARAEAAWEALAQVLPEPDGGDRVELLLTDQVDLSNGLATVSPARRVVVYLRPPVDGFALAHFDDWLDLVIVHELAHIFHLDVTSRFGDFLRRVFGRVPAPWPFFPGIGTPDWAVEGLATWYETLLTGSGRTRGTYFEMMLRTAALEGNFSTIDRATGKSPQWPAGESDYLYGSLFFDHLLETYGEEGMRRFVLAVGGQWVPYRLNAAAEDAFDVSFSDAWEAWALEWRARATASVEELESSGPLTRPVHHTRRGRLAVHPSVSPDGTVAFSRADGRSDPQIRIVSGTGEDTRFLVRTHGLSRFDWAPDGSMVLGQPEFSGPYRIYSDLWRRDPAGRMERLTEGARLDHPTVSPNGNDVVAVEYRGAGSRLVRIPLPGGERRVLTAEGEGVAWAFPAYSPDGNWVAASRWSGDGADILVLNALTGEVVLEVTADRALDLAPAWSPDGSTLLWGSDRSGIPQIVAAAVDPLRGTAGPVRGVTRVVSGAAFPTVDPADSRVYFSHYTSHGWELASIPFDSTQWTDAGPLDPRFQVPPARLVAPPVEGTLTDYASLPSLRPRYWQPITLPGHDTPDGDLLKPFVGFATQATDLVDRHAVLLQGAISLSGKELDGRLQYVYAGLGNPVIDLLVEQEWDGEGPFQARADPEAEPETLYIREREQRVSLGGTLTRGRWTSWMSLSGRAGMVWESRRLLDRTFRPSENFVLYQPDSRLAEGRVSLAVNTSRGHALSISREEGMSAFVLLRARKEVALADSLVGETGFDRSTDELVGQLQFYQSVPGPGFSDHVMAVRLAGGAARGPGADALTFEVGGASGQREPITGLDLFGGTSLFFPVRGYATGTRSGRFAWAGSAEYRFPLALVNRGLGLFPIHLDRLHGAVFADAANAWGPELDLAGFNQPRLDPIWSAGVELSASFTFFFDLSVTLRSGVAFLGREVGMSRSPGWYLRLGPSF